MPRRVCFLGMCFWIGLLAASLPVGGVLQGDELRRWEKTTIRPVLPEETACHSIHAYYVTSPESPDGKRVLFFRSTEPDSHRGDICFLERATGEVHVLVANVEVQDAHRVACQQWARNGASVIYHALEDDVSVVMAVDVESRKTKELARGRQLGFFPPHAEKVPIYGQHWAPAEFTDIELMDVTSGERTTALRADSVRPACQQSNAADFFSSQFDNRRLSTFFPILSPNHERLIFKLSTPNGEGYRGRSAGSDRHGLLGYDLLSNRYLFIHANWGHPAWHADSRRVVNIWKSGVVLVNLETGDVEKQFPMPEGMRYGIHPALSPDGKLVVADGRMESAENAGQQWGIAVGDVATGEWRMLHRFEEDPGAQSWRRSHPHPVFGPDGQRIYFHLNTGNWTRLHIVEFKSE